MVKKRSDRTEVRADQVIAELVHLAFANALDYVTIGEDGEPFYDLSRLTRDQGSAVAEITLDTLKTGDRDPVLTTRTRVKLHPKLPALLELGKHLGLFKGGAAGRTPNATEHPPDLLAKDDPLRVDVIERFAKAAEKWAKPASQTGKAT